MFKITHTKTYINYYQKYQQFCKQTGTKNYFYFNVKECMDTY